MLNASVSFVNIFNLDEMQVGNFTLSCLLKYVLQFFVVMALSASVLRQRAIACLHMCIVEYELHQSKWMPSKGKTHKASLCCCVSLSRSHRLQLWLQTCKLMLSCDAGLAVTMHFIQLSQVILSTHNFCSATASASSFSLKNESPTKLVSCQLLVMKLEVTYFCSYCGLGYCYNRVRSLPEAVTDSLQLSTMQHCAVSVMLAGICIRLNNLMHMPAQAMMRCILLDFVWFDSCIMLLLACIQ